MQSRLTKSTEHPSFEDTGSDFGGVFFFGGVFGAGIARDLRMAVRCMFETRGLSKSESLESVRTWVFTFHESALRVSAVGGREEARQRGEWAAQESGRRERERRRRRESTNGRQTEKERERRE